MKALGKITIPVRSLGDTWRLYALGDVHWGNRGCAASKFRGVVERIQHDRRCLAFLMGDQIDAISIQDKRFDPGCLDERALRSLADLGNMGEVLMDSFAEEVRPIRSKIRVALMGNHEAVYMRRTEHARLHSNFCREMDAIDGGYCCFTDLVFEDPEKKRATFRVFAHHGAGAAITPGGKLNRLIRFMDMANADIVLTGHTHESAEYARTRLGSNRECSKITHVDQLGVVCGTFLRTYTQDVTGYGEARGYHPTSIASPAIEIVPATRTLGVRWLRG